ncbi:MAG TPA: endosialidase [Candidatus Egerieimonas faecigallinarum]|nr:endosialidase [Candidatus Egerieimonas faecigallinarum]
MAVINELIRAEQDGSISFGNYELETKSKRSDFEHNGDMYKVKTFYEITKLERNGMFVYESVPGTAVTGLELRDDGMKFSVEGKEDAQITVELEADTEYKVLLDDVNVGHMMTNLGGKLSFSAELGEADRVNVEIVKL